MERQIEKLLTVVMFKVIEGIPDGKGGFIEQPVESAAAQFVKECGGEMDAAVAAVAHDVLVSRPSWSKSVWKGALLVVVGQVPFVGSTAAVFASQFEAVWRQIRFLAIAATIYGHDVTDDVTQCQIILCLLDDKIRKGDGVYAIDKIYSKGMRSGIQVAATVIARQVLATGGKGFLMKRVLGGLLLGVVPEAVGVVYTAFLTGTGLSSEHHERSMRAKQLNDRSREHFKKEEQPSRRLLITSFLIWALPLLYYNGFRIWRIYDRMWRHALRLPPMQSFRARILGAWEALDGSLGLVQLYPSLNEPMLPVSVSLGLEALVGLGIAAATVRFCLMIGRRQTWVVTACALSVRAVLKFLSAKNTATSLGCALAIREPDALYNAHVAAVGLYTILASYVPDLKRHQPLAVASLLVWILYSATLFLVLYVHACYPVLVEGIFGGDGSAAVALADFRAHNADFVTSGLAGARMKDAIGATGNIALHVLLNEVRRPDLLMGLVGPKKVVEGILFAAKSLGNAVANPDSVLIWLDRSTPPTFGAWIVLTLQYCSTPLGLAWGLALHFGLLTVRELVILSYAACITVAFVLWLRRLPPPYNDLVWKDALQSRHRLLYLIPELNSGVRDRLYFAISFFDTYKGAIARSQDLTSSRFVKVKDWVATSFSKREKLEFEALRAEDTVEFDCSVYHGSKGQSWSAWLFGGPSEQEDQQEERQQEALWRRWMPGRWSATSQEALLEDVAEEPTVSHAEEPAVSHVGPGQTADHHEADAHPGIVEPIDVDPGTHAVANEILDVVRDDDQGSCDAGQVKTSSSDEQAGEYGAGVNAFVAAEDDGCEVDSNAVVSEEALSVVGKEDDGTAEGVDVGEGNDIAASPEITTAIAVDPSAEAEAEAEVEAEAEAETEIEPDVEAKADTEAEAEAEAETETGAETEIEAEADTEIETEVETEAEVGGLRAMIARVLGRQPKSQLDTSQEDEPRPQDGSTSGDSGSWWSRGQPKDDRETVYGKGERGWWPLRSEQSDGAADRSDFATMRAEPENVAAPTQLAETVEAAASAKAVGVEPKGHRDDVDVTEPAGLDETAEHAEPAESVKTTKPAEPTSDTADPAGPAESVEVAGSAFATESAEPDEIAAPAKNAGTAEATRSEDEGGWWSRRGPSKASEDSSSSFFARIWSRQGAREAEEEQQAEEEAAGEPAPGFLARFWEQGTPSEASDDAAGEAAQDAVPSLLGRFWRRQHKSEAGEALCEASAEAPAKATGEGI